MNWSILIAFGIAALVLVLFLIWQNQKDEKSFEKGIKNDYPKPKEREGGDIDVEEILK